MTAEVCQCARCYSTLVCQRCGAVVDTKFADRHDRLHTMRGDHHYAPDPPTSTSTSLNLWVSDAIADLDRAASTLDRINRSGERLSAEAAAHLRGAHYRAKSAVYATLRWVDV